MSDPAYTLDGRPASRDAFYAAACDPARHVVVEACAGAGKTWMLVSRILRALVDGAAPQEILAITFTRKAAGEMRTRLGEWLREFSVMPPQDAAAELVQRGVSAAEAPRQAAALIGLHERVLAAGRTVEVHTFHAWFSQLLRAAPLDLLASLGLAPDLALIENTTDLEPELWRAFQAAVLAEPELLAAYRLLTLRRGRATLARWLATALARRVEIELADAAGVLEASVEPGAVEHPAARIREPAFVAAVRSLARALAARGAVKSNAAAQGLTEALEHADACMAYAALRAALFTAKGEGTPRKQLGELPAQAALCTELDLIAEEVAQFEAHEEHLAMVALSRQLFAQYAALKQRQGLVDMPDLERVALALLADHPLAGWVQERLDARVRHLLIDEFQDTSPLQWHALHAWLSAYAGAGGGQTGPRLFIVGDPKQSIYRFRRAEPRVFQAAQTFVVEALGGTLAACDHTRRCAPGVVAVVNAVFGGAAVDGAPAWRAHTTEVSALNAAPALLALPTIERPPRAQRAVDEPPAAREWRPSLTVPRHSPETVLREAEADAVARAIAALIRREGVAPGEIMVLARKREPLRLAAEALAAAQLPFVAPDDARLADLAEVQDLLAVLDVLASSGQSLSLARALKSPLFGVGDAGLLWLAGRARQGAGWWSALAECAAADGAPSDDAPALWRAAHLLASWKAVADTLPPHDLLDRIVHEGDLLPRLVAVVPAARCKRAVDAVRALLAAALALDGGRFATLHGFVRALRRRRIDAPPSAHPDAVQLLTIHGAKGLEARIVFVMDTEPEARKAETATLLVEWPVESAAPRRAAFIAAESRCPPSLQLLLATEQAARDTEEGNALYVALTRAEERLVISRTPPHAGATAPSWWQRLETLAEPWEPGPLSAARAGSGAARLAQLPLHSRAAPRTEPDADAASSTARLGQALHRWLEWAAHDPVADRAALAAQAAAAFGVADASAVAALGSRIIDSPDCRAFFDPTAIAWAGNEVPIADATGQARRIDRLVQTSDAAGTWWVLDYKLAGRPETDPALLAQLEGYRLAVAALSNGAPVRAAFITGAGERIEPGLIAI